MQMAQKTIRIKWVRSGIGFERSQSEVVRSLGLRRLNHVVERPDTPQVRGLVAKVAHLVEVVSDVSEPLWASTPVYVIQAAASEPEGGTGVPPAPGAHRVPGQAGETPALPGQPASEESLSAQGEEGTEDKEQSEKI